LPLFGKLNQAVPDRCYRLVLITCAAYSVITALIPFARLVPRFPLQLLVPVILYLAYRARAVPDSVKRWFYYLMLTGSYQALRFVVSTRFEGFHGSGVIQMEQSLFGTLPTIWLQQHLHPGPGLAFYDYIFALLHASLFAFPVLLPGLLLWRRGAASMKRASVAVTLISMAGYLTYVVFPLTPPWMAHLEGLLPAGDRVVYDALKQFTGNWLAGAFQPSPRGAMPSLHAGLPFLTLLACFHEFGRKSLWVAIPVAGICFEVVYGAEHYVIDVAAGILYGIAAYVITYHLLLPDRLMRSGCCGEDHGGSKKRDDQAPG